MERSLDFSVRRIEWTRVITLTWWASILLLAFALPFELVSPWVKLGDALVFTNLEVIALISVSLWIARQVLLKQSPRELWRTPLALPLVLLMVALLLSSVLAPSENLHALKVTARWGMGAAIFLMVVNALDSGLPARYLIQASVIGGIVVAALALFEVATVQNIQMLLGVFRQEPVFQVGGEVRASSTLGYPTIAAVYLEFIFFFIVGWLAREWLQRRWLRASILFAASVVVSEALLLTLTRSALLAVAGAIILIIVIRWLRARLDHWTRSAFIAGLGLALLFLVSYFFNPVTQLRLLTESDRSWYRANYQVTTLPELSTEQMITIPVQVQNIGLHAWEANGARAVHLSYHWLSNDSQSIYVADGLRTQLPHDLAPGESATLKATVRAPARAGNYLLAWDMVREDLFWFSVLGWPEYQIPVRVLPGQVTNSPIETASPNVAGNLTIERGTLWLAAIDVFAAHPLLGVGAGNFRLVFGNYLHLSFWDNRLHANNMYLELLADAGALGGLAFLFLIFSSAKLAWRELHAAAQTNSDKMEKVIWFASLAAALVAFLIHGVTDYFMEFTPVYLLVWMTLGLLVALTRQDRSRA